MNALRVLMDQFWVVKERDRDLYFAVKSGIGEYKSFIEEQLGYQLYVNEKLIKLEKLPGRADPAMGIEGFDEILCYLLLCALLAFLDDKTDGQAFLLTELTEFLSAYFTQNGAGAELDWTSFSCRKTLVRVMQYAEEIGLVRANDGKSEDYRDDQSTEVLYENTGTVRYFSVQFTRDISDYTSAEDFAAAGLSVEEAARGTPRVNRVYRRLALSPAVYWNEGDPTGNDPDYTYIKNQRSWVSHYLQNLDARLELYYNGAFAVSEQENSPHLTFPDDRGVCDVALLLCRLVRERVDDGRLRPDRDGCIRLDREAYFALLADCKTQFGHGWIKAYREGELAGLERDLTDYMTCWMLLRREGDLFVLLPAVGRFAGRYPPEFAAGEPDCEEVGPEQVRLGVWEEDEDE